MFGLLRNNPKKIPFLGDILFSILTFPVTFTFMEKWGSSRKVVGLTETR